MRIYKYRGVSVHLLLSTMQTTGLQPKWWKLHVWYKNHLDLCLQWNNDLHMCSGWEFTVSWKIRYFSGICLFYHMTFNRHNGEPTYCWWWKYHLFVILSTSVHWFGHLTNTNKTFTYAAKPGPRLERGKTTTKLLLGHILSIHVR